MDGQTELTSTVGYITKMVYPPADGHPSKYWPGPIYVSVYVSNIWYFVRQNTTKHRKRKTRAEISKHIKTITESLYRP